MRISDWSSDVCSSDLDQHRNERGHMRLARRFRIFAPAAMRFARDRRATVLIEMGFAIPFLVFVGFAGMEVANPIGRARWRERVGQYVLISGVDDSFTQKI